MFNPIEMRNRAEEFVNPMTLKAWEEEN